MSHYVEAKRMLSDPFVGEFLRQSLKRVFRDGYAFKDPYYSNNVPEVEILINKMDPEKSVLFKVAMRVMQIDFSCPCGLTRQIEGNFRAEIRELKRLLTKVVGVEPDEDTNLSVAD